MFSWFVSFLAIAVIAAILGFGGLAGTANGIAEILAAAFLIAAVGSLLIYLKNQRGV